MRQFVTAHQELITGVLTCFDRVIFHGHLTRISTARGFAAHLVRLGVPLRELKQWGERCRVRLVRYARSVAERSERPFLMLKGNDRQEDVVQKVIRERRLTRGLVCVISGLEMMRSFRLRNQSERPFVIPDWRRGQVLYFYRIDPQFGLMHTRVQTWAPFTTQVYVNGHFWLERELRRQRKSFRCYDNVFTEIRDIEHAQALADQFSGLPWVEELDQRVRPLVPLLEDDLAELKYYWCVDQAECATDVMFRDTESLAPLYLRLVRHGMLDLGCEDVMRFLGRSITPSFKGQIQARLERRWQGLRLKYKVNRNWVKLYDKHGSVLRAETTINRPGDFRKRVHGTDSRDSTDSRWIPINKGVHDFHRIEHVQRQANARLLDALAIVESPDPRHKEILKSQRPVSRKGRRFAGLNHLGDHEQALYAAVLDGAHHLRGFLNRDIRTKLHPRAASKPEMRRQAAAITRRLQKLHAHGLIGKIPHTHRWYVTEKGLRVMATALRIRDELLPQGLVA